MACTNNSWTKVITVLTIIFCFAYVLTQILVLTLKVQWEELIKIWFYIEFVKKETYYLIYCSIVFNSLWMIASIVLLTFLRNTESHEYSIRQTQKLLKFYTIWIISGFISFIPDVVSMILHGIYYGSVASSTNTFEKIYRDGALYMLLLSSRFGVILAFHIFSWIGMIIITIALQKSLNEDGTKPKGRIVPLKPPKPAIKPSKVPYLEENNADRVRDWYKHYEGDNKNVANDHYYSEPNARPNYVPRVNGNTNPAFVNNNYGPMSRPTSPPVPPPKPAQHHMPGANTNVLVNGVPSGTLRRQLPWSYMPQGSELPQRPPPKQFPLDPGNSSVTGGFAPYVPAPDYGGSPKKVQRQEFSQPGWNQYL